MYKSIARNAVIKQGQTELFKLTSTNIEGFWVSYMSHIRHAHWEGVKQYLPGGLKLVSKNLSVR